MKNIWLGDNKLEYMRSQIITPILGNELDVVDFSGNTKINTFYHRVANIGDNQVSLKQLLKLRIAAHHLRK